MGQGKGQVSWGDHTEFLQYVIYIFNTIFFCAGALVFAIAMWIRFDNDMNDFIESVSMYHYWWGAIVVMVGACLVMLTSFIGCCGAYAGNRFLIVIYMCMTVVTFIMLLAGSAYTLDNGMEDTKAYPYIQEEMRRLIYLYQWDVAARRSVDIIQEYVGCCGGYSADDFTNIHLPVPNTCRDQVTGNQYGDSCGEILSQYLEVRTGWLAGLSLSLCFFQCFAVMVSVCTYMAFKERDEYRRRGM